MTDVPKMTRDSADQLRRHFPPEQVSKLPRGGTSLSYVGHADVTSRLLETDPEWNWEPLAFDEQGMPVFDLADNGKPVGLWIKLTVCGVTRLGYGSVPANQVDAVKVLIGDALRNAAMRFGVALDLWAKGDRDDPTAENPSGPAGNAVRRSTRSPAKGTYPGPGKTEGPEYSDVQALIVAAAEAGTPEKLRYLYKYAATAGWLKLEAVLPATGEKVTVESYLTSRGNDLKHDKSRPAASEGVSGGGDSQ